VLDACVLFPASLRDTLLRAAEHDLYQPRWSRDILEELRRSLVEHGKSDSIHAQRLIDTLREAFDDAEVWGYEHLIKDMPNHPLDRHVLAAAVASQADAIVTLNVKDFPAESARSLGLQVQTPDVFLMRLFDEAPRIMEQITEEQAAFLRNPPMTIDDVLDNIEPFAPSFVRAVRQRRSRRG